ncbi:anti-anti-sigma factor [Pueribacillus theae]|uniref:Anti-anti-sigma factor n=1 Tax=Pueribacillus theae TaxID=2171751 RepID=A0A2U1JXY2_9BACI|nr:STAS domain-containing protein [Pueribacillus theae]PWA10081.1 anti-anti-sigma factor [Pueribacillus theae]
MESRLAKTDTIKNFFIENQSEFSKQLLEEAINVRDKINEIHRIGNIDLISNANRLALYVVEGKRDELVEFAKVEGEAWACHELTVSFKLEWLQAIHRVLWRFLYHFECMQEKEADREAFFTLERNINEMMDIFLNTFFLSFSDFKERRLKTQQELIENLSVPIIPITDSVSILPLIGEIDPPRIQTIKEKLLRQISVLKISTIIIDFSGVTILERQITEEIKKVLQGVKMMGCKPIITGLRPKTVQTMMDFCVALEEYAETKGTLQKALNSYFK